MRTNSYWHRAFSFVPLVLCLTIWMASSTYAQQQSRYVRKNSGADVVIVFVHGVLGDSVSTWTNGTIYWPDLLTRDRTFDHADIYVYEYPTSLGSPMSIDELSEDMRLKLHEAGVSSHKQIVFLAHSMGGLVTRSYLLKYRDVATRTAFIYFFSTPTTGSEVANVAKLISGSPSLANMRIATSEGYLAEQFRTWMAARFSLPSFCAYEKRRTSGLEVVSWASAAGLCNQRLDPIDANHLQIVKPSGENHPSYLAFKSAFQEVIKDKAIEQKSAFEVHPSFRPVYDSFASELGRPRGPSQLSDDTYQAEYDLAHIVWIKYLLTIYVLPLDDRDRKVIRQPDPTWGGPDLFDDEKLRPLFNTPSDKFPPHGGVANHWLRNPDRWKWVGWRRWFCRFFDEIFYQQFDTGIMMGVFHTSPDRDDGQVFVLLNNGEWHSRLAPVKAPECRQIAEPFPTR